MKFSNLKEGDILVPNGKTKQSCENVFRSEDVEVEFIKYNNYGSDITVRLIKGKLYCKYYNQYRRKRESFIVNFKHFKVKDLDSYEIF